MNGVADRSLKLDVIREIGGRTLRRTGSSTAGWVIPNQQVRAEGRVAEAAVSSLTAEKASHSPSGLFIFLAVWLLGC